MAEDPKNNQELAEEYKSQSMGTAMRVNYKGPTDRADSWVDLLLHCLDSLVVAPRLQELQ